MEVFLRLLDIYRRQDLQINTGLYPWHFERLYPPQAILLHMFAPFTGIAKEEKGFSTGGGIHILEILLLEAVSRDFQPKNIFIIGNAFGWSTFALALANPSAQIVAIDALVEGNDALYAHNLCQKIIEDEGFENVKILHASSPQDVESVVNTHLNGPIELALIDGKHTPQQQTLDFQAIQQVVADEHIVFLHDVLNWNLTESFVQLRATYNSLVAKMLMRTPSGMAVFHTPNIPASTARVIDAFTASKESIRSLQKETQRRVKRTREQLGLTVKARTCYDYSPPAIELSIEIKK